MNHFKRAFQKMFPFFLPFRLCIDTGTATTRIAIADKGVIFREATYLGYNSRTQEYIFYGDEAKTILGKTPNFVQITRPVANGILYDFDAEVEYLHRAITKSISPYTGQYPLIHPQYSALTSFPTIATEIEQKALYESLVKVGCRNTLLIERPIATAAGCGYNVFSHEPHLILDMGAGLVEISIVSGGGVVLNRTIKHGGDYMNKVLSNYVYVANGIILGEQTCEDIKKKLLTFDSEDKTLSVRGKSMDSGLPKEVRLKSSEVRESLLPAFAQVVDVVRELTELSPPEIADEIFKNGLTLTGGMSCIKGLETYIKNELHIESHVPEHASDATIYGLMYLEKQPEELSRLYG